VKPVTEDTQEKKKALIIGISDYDNLSLPHLEFCKNDGDEMSNFLQSQGYEIPKENKLIGKINHQIMRNAIIQFFTNENIKPKDLLLFYFSGHGLIEDNGDNYLATSEADPDRPYESAIPFDELTKMANRSISNKIVMILDCCYSGGAIKGGKGNPEDAANIGRDSIDKAIAQRVGEGVCVLASSQAYQESYGKSQLNHSLFTYYLLYGLKGVKGESADIKGNVTPNLLSKYVYEKIMSLQLDKRPKQKPIRKIDSSNEIILAHYKSLMGSTELSKVDYLLNLLKDGHIAEFNDIRTQDDYANLSAADIDLRGKELRDVNLERIMLREANLQGADLTSANLNITDLQGADLRGARFLGASIIDTNLQGADLQGAEIFGASIIETNLQGADLTGARFLGVDFGGNVSFVGANLKGTEIVGSHFNGIVNFAGAEFSGTNILGSRFDGIVTFVNFNARDVEINGVSSNKGMVTYNFQNATNLTIHIVDWPSSNKYAETLKKFKKILNTTLKPFMIPSEQLVPILEGLESLSQELEDIKPRQELEYYKKTIIESKIASIIQKTLNILPKTVSDVSIFKTLSPFGKLIDKQILQMVEVIRKRQEITRTNISNNKKDHD
jgi:uncharacterized protein YjbI with pentapeptide repeats